MSPHPFPERAPNQPPPPPMPLLTVLGDGRFAIRTGLRLPSGEEIVERTWTVLRWGEPANAAGPAMEGWVHDCYMTDAQVAEADAQVVWPSVNVARLADDLDGAGQFTASRFVRDRIAHERLMGGLTGREQVR